jgi:eukaryotic translation initiation factor 2C
MTELPIRPDLGTLGKRIPVQVNIFPVTQLSQLSAFQYDVAIVPEIPSKEKAVKLPDELCRRVFRQVEVLLKEKYKNCWMVFDGSKNAYSTMKIADCEFDVYVKKQEEMELPPSAPATPASAGRGRGRGGPRGGGPRGGHHGGGSSHSSRPISLVLRPVTVERPGQRDTERFKVKMKLVADLNLGRLLEFCNKKCPEDATVTHATQCLSVVLRYVPSLLFVPVGSNFFTPEGRVPISGGMEVWRGYHQSIREMMAGHLGINIDLASTVFRMGGISALDYVSQVCNKRVEDIGTLSRDRLSKALKGVNCITTHRGDSKVRFKIAKLSDKNSDTLVFADKDGAKVSVAEYFLKEYNYKIRFPKLPLALKGNGKTAFPLECLRIQPAQRFRGRMSGDQTSDMIRATVQKPHERKQQVLNAVKSSLKYDGNDYLKSFGMKISDEMMTVESRVLPAPKVQFKSNSVNGDSGAWNLKGAKVDTIDVVGRCSTLGQLRICLLCPSWAG